MSSFGVNPPSPYVLSPFRGGDSYAGWSLYTPVKPPKPDRLKDRGQKSSSTASVFLYFPIFFSFTFLLFYSFISPISMLYSSVCNLFALIGRKAPFTHSLGVNPCRPAFLIRNHLKEKVDGRMDERMDVRMDGRTTNAALWHKFT